jgi:ATP-dependent protease ClpP protease subunit
MEIVEIEIKGDFNEQMQSKFESDMKALTSPCVCVLDIESPGGYVPVLEAMVNIISQKKQEGFVFVTNVDWYAYSCAFMLFLIGDIKVVSDTAELMYHSAGLVVDDRLTAAEAKEIYDVLAKADEITDRIVLENTDITPEMFNLIKKNTTFFDKQDLINFGIMQKEYSLN